MKKTIQIMLGGFALLFLGAGRVFAVWPPSTTLEEEANTKSTENGSEAMAVTSPRLRLVVDRLESDERRFVEMLNHLDADQKKLNRSVEKPTHDSKSVSPKENDNGHPLR